MHRGGLTAAMLFAPAIVSAVPTTPVITATTTVTSGKVGLTATTGAQSGVTFTWSFSPSNGGTITSGQGTNSMVYTAGAAGSYTLTCVATDSLSNTATGTKTITVAPAPVAPTITSESAVTASSTGHAASIAAQTGMTYTWTLANGSVTAGAGTTAITYTAGATVGSMTLTCTVKNVVNEVASSTNTVSVIAAPVSVITVSKGSFTNLTTVTNGNTGLMASVASQAGSTYTWTATNAAIDVGAGTNAITFHPTVATGTVTLSCTVTNTLGTSKTGTKSLTLVPQPSTAVITTAADITEGATSHTISATSINSAVYAWQPLLDVTYTSGTAYSTSYTTTATNTTANASAAVLGLSCLITNQDGVSATITKNVNVWAPPTTPVVVTTKNDGTTPETQVTVSTTGHKAHIAAQSNATYAWTLVDGSVTAGAGTTEITFTASTTTGTAAFKATCTVTNKAGTAVSAFATEDVLVAPVAVITASKGTATNLTTVTNGNTGLTASVASQAGSTYAWTATNGAIDAGAGTNAITFHPTVPTGTVTLSCTVTNSLGSSVTGTKGLTVLADPATAVITTGANITEGPTSHTVSVTYISSATYTWQQPAGVSYAAPASYSTSYTTTATNGTANASPAVLALSCVVTNPDGASATIAKSVNLWALPAAPAVITTKNDGVTSESQVTVSTTGHKAHVVATPNTTYTWVVTNGSITAGQGTTEITFNAGPTAGTANLIVTCTAANPAGGTQAGSATEDVLTAPVATITVSSGTAPSLTTVTNGNTGLVASVTNQVGYTYVWNLTNGAVDTGAGTSAITFHPTAVTGSMTLSCQVTNTLGTSVTATKTLTILAQPSTAVITTGANITEGPASHSVSVTNLSYATYAWQGTASESYASSTSTSTTYTTTTVNGAANVSANVLTLSCVVTNPDGASATVTKNVNLWAVPSVPVLGTTKSDGSTVETQVTASTPGHMAHVATQPNTTYSWAVANGSLTAGQGTAAITFSAGATPGTGNLLITCTATNPAGATNRGSVAEDILAAPSSAITAFSSTAANLTMVTAGFSGLQARVADLGTGATYLWTITGGTILAGNGTSSIQYSDTAAAGSTLTLGVTVTNSLGATSTGQKVLSVLAAPGTRVITTASDINQGMANNPISISTLTGASYAWQATDSTVFASGSSATTTYTTSVVNVTANSAPVPLPLSCVVTNVDGASATITKTVNLWAMPSVPVVVTTMDDGTTLESRVTATTASHKAHVAAQLNATYAWTVSNGTITAGQGTTEIAYTAGATSGLGALGVTCVVTNPAGGSSTGSASQEVVAVPDGTLTVSKGASSNLPNVTAGNSGIAASVPAQAGASYAWTLTGAALTSGAGTNTITFTVTAPANGSVVLDCTVTNTAGTAVLGSTTLPVLAAPVATITADPAITFDGTGLVTHPVSVNTGTGYSYAWTAATSDAGHGITPTTSTASAFSYKTASVAGSTLTLTCTVTSADGVSSPASSVSVQVNAPAIAVSVSPSVVSLTPSQVQSFTATVTNTTNTAVTWSATAGAITTAGSYTAPATVGTYTVKALSKADGTTFGTASVTVATAPTPGPGITITPAAAVVNAMQSVTFTAKLTGMTNTSVGWRKISGLGSITSAGVYTAGAAINSCFDVSPISEEIFEAYSIADPTIIARVGVTVQVPPYGTTGISIAQPAKLQFVEGDTASFSGSASGVTDTRLMWQDSTGQCGNYGTNANGVISGLGSFTAIGPGPSSAWGQDGSYWRQLRAISVADRTRWSYLPVRIWRKGMVVLTPGTFIDANNKPTQTVMAGAQLQLKAEVKGGGSVIWSVPSGNGSVSTTGLFTAPPAPLASYLATVRATNAADATLYAEVQVPLTQAGVVVLSQSATAVVPGGKVTFSATTTNTNDGVLWSVRAADTTKATGSVTTKGVYTAPSSLDSGESYRGIFVRATNAKNPALYAEGYVKVETLPSTSGAFAVVSTSWPDSSWVATYDATGNTQGGWGTDPSKFWTISGNGTIISTWFDGTYGYPCVAYKTGAIGTMTLTAHPTNELGTVSVSKTVSIVAVPDLSGAYTSASGGEIDVLDFGIKTVARPDGQTASMHRLWAHPGLRWAGRQLVGSGISTFYTGNSDWTGTSSNATFAVDGLSINNTYTRSSIIIIGAEPATTVEDGSTVLGPSLAYVQVGKTLQLQSAVGGTTDKAVTWSCPAGNGTVSSTGLYTAPATPGTYSVTVTAHAVPNPTYTLTIRVGAAANLAASSVVGSYASPVSYLGEGTTGQGNVSAFTDGTSVYLKGSDTTNSLIRTGGQIRGASLAGYNGIRAVFNPQADGSAMPIIDYPHTYYGGWWIGDIVERVAFDTPARTSAIGVEIIPNTPSPLKVTDGLPISVTALTANTSGVTWDAGPQQANISISGSTLSWSANTAGLGILNGVPTLSITATSPQDSTKSASVQIAVQPQPVTPVNQVTPASVTTLAAYPAAIVPTQFTATFPNQPTNDATWSITEGAAGGTISATGLYRPGTSTGVFHIVAASQWDSTQKVTAVVTVSEGTPRADLSLSNGFLNPGQPLVVSWTNLWALNTANPNLALTVRDTVTGASQTLDVTGLASYTVNPVHSTAFTLTITSASGLTGTATGFAGMNISQGASLYLNPTPLPYNGTFFATAFFGQGVSAQLQVYNGSSWVNVGPLTSGWAAPVDVKALLGGPVATVSVQALLSDAAGDTGQVFAQADMRSKILSFKATPPRLLTGSPQPVTLSWSLDTLGRYATIQIYATTSTGTLGSLIYQGSTSDGVSSFTVQPTDTTTYELQVTTRDRQGNLTGSAIGTEIQDLVVKVGSVASVSLSPATLLLTPGASASLAAAISALPGQDSLTWSCTGGLISGSGTSASYTAPLTIGTYQVTVASSVDPTVSATTLITVQAAGSVGGGTTLAIQSFTAGPSPLGTNHQLLAWAVSGATSLSLRDSNGTVTDVTGQTSLDVVPSGTTIYTLSASDGKNTVSQNVTIPGVGYAIALTPTQVTMFTGVTYKFGYSIYAPSNQVTWTCDGGTIAVDGTYTAPATAGTYTVTATLVDDPTRSSSATVTVNEVSLQVMPGYLNLVTGQTYGFGWQGFTFSDDHPTWSTDGGTIQPTGVFTAPSTPGTVTVTLTSSKDTTKTATATVNVRPIDLMVLPGTAWVLPQAQYQFAAATSLGAVTWSVVEAGGGSITSDGIYTAPNVVGTYTVKATSVVDPTRFATAQVIAAATGGGNWNPPEGGGTISSANNGVSVDPPMSRVDAGTYTALTATVLGSDDQSVTWSLAGGATSRADVDDQGVFTAHEAGLYTVVATSKSNPALQGSAILVVESSIHGLNNVPAALQLEGYSITVLTDGRVLIAGGQDTTVTSTDPVKGYRGTAYLYDPAAKTFTQTGNLLQARAGHTATLLSDGRVLIAGGMGYFKWPTDPNATAKEQGVKWGEIYNPTTGLFEALPVPPDHVLYPAGSMRSAHGTAGSAVTLVNGQVLITGGYWGNAPYDPFDLYDPTISLFDLTDISQPASGATSLEQTQSFETRIDSAVAALDDGRALLTGGTHQYQAIGDPSPCGHSQCTLTEARIFDPQTRTLAPINGMTQARSGHTMTKLPNGKILIIGGSDHGTWDSTSMSYFPNPTATAEIFDPATGTFTSTGSMKWPRINHAAILLPTGQVMVVGGELSIVPDGAGGDIRSYPTETEIYDPDAGTFSVMDKMAFGLDKPKLALLQDGGVFMSGKSIAASSMGTPAAASKAYGMKSVRSQIAFEGQGGPLGLQEAVFGIEAPAGLVLDYVTMNQGVERYLNSTNSPDGKPSINSKLAFKPMVPGVAGRPGRFQFTLHTTVPLTASVAQKLSIAVDTPKRFSPKTLLSIIPMRAPIFGSHGVGTLFRSEPLILESGETVAGATLTGVLDYRNAVISSTAPASQRLFIVDPKWVTRPTLQVQLIPVNYTDQTGTIYPTSITETTRQEVEDMLKVVFPVATVSVIVAPDPIAYNALQPDGTLSPLTSESGETALVTLVKNRWTLAGSPAYIHYSGIFHYVPGSVYPAGGLGYTPGSPTDFGPYSIALDLSLGKLGCSLLPHELGHNHGLQHAPNPAVNGPNGCNLGITIPAASNPDKAYPYENAELGGVMGFNTQAEVLVDTVSDPKSYHDIMGYWYPQHPSDYFFTKTSKWAMSVAPPPVTPANLLKIAGTIVQSNPSLVAPVSNYVIEVDGRFMKSDMTIPKLNSTLKLNKAILPIKDNEWLIQVKNSLGSSALFPLSVGEISEMSISVYKWSARIPDGDWVSYKILHNMVEVGGESFVGISDEMEAHPNQPLFRVEGGMLHWNLPVRPTHGLFAWVVNDKGEYEGTLETGINPLAIGETEIPRRHFKHGLLPRVRVQIGYGLQVRDFTFRMEPSHTWTFQDLKRSTLGGL